MLRGCPELPRNWSLLSFVILYVGGTVLAGRTLGLRLAGLRLAQAGGSGRIGLGRAIVRTGLLMLVRNLSRGLRHLLVTRSV